jgi:protein gp37
MIIRNYTPWVGCHPYSDGCKNCFTAGLSRQPFHLAESIDDILDLKVFPPGSNVRVCIPSDFWIEEADEYRPHVYNMILSRTDFEAITFVTKRVHRWREGFDDRIIDNPIVTFGCTMESQRALEERRDSFREATFPHKIAILAPMIEEMDVSSILDFVDQVWVNGEMGDPRKIRPMRYEWLLKLHNQCVEADIGFHISGTGSVFYDKAGKANYNFSERQLTLGAERLNLDYKSTIKRYFNHNYTLEIPS